jgi:hypothetical protein
MEWGFSRVRQKSVYATELKHGDAATLQVGCPICGEALFLCIGQRPRHMPYLAHYKAVEGVACELRVASLPRPPTKHPLSPVPRGQELTRYFAEFEGYALLGYCDAFRLTILKQQASMRRRSVYRRYPRIWRDSARGVIHDATWLAGLEHRHPNLDEQLAVTEVVAFLLAANSFEPITFALAMGMSIAYSNCRKRVENDFGSERPMAEGRVITKCSKLPTMRCSIPIAS